MSVIGIDFGNDNCIIAVARAGGIETIDNDFSLRATPSYVGFGERCRVLGVSAKNSHIANIKSTVYGFKRFLGRTFQDVAIKEITKEYPFETVPINNGKFEDAIGFKVEYGKKECAFSTEQITGMLFTKLKQIAEHALDSKVDDCVVSVPNFFTDGERRSLLQGCQIAGFNILNIMNDTSAAALNYGFFKTDLPSMDSAEPPRNVFFVDCGHSAVQVCACEFYEGEFKVLAATADPWVGGRDFDNKIVEYFCNDFKKRYGIDVNQNARAKARLTIEAEKLKKQMSANKMKMRLAIECFMNDIDVEGWISRAEFEELISELISKVEIVLLQCLRLSELSLENVHSVEIIGGSTRIPALKELIIKVFEKAPSTTLNADEAVARGCALQCAILSPLVKVKHFTVSSKQFYPINLAWKMESEDIKTVGLFSTGHTLPFSRLVSITRRPPLSIAATYSGPMPIYDKGIALYEIISTCPLEPGKMKLKFRLNENGLLSLIYARYEKLVGAMKNPTLTSNVNEDEDQDMIDEASTLNGTSKRCENPQSNSEVKCKFQELSVQITNLDIPKGILEEMYELEMKMVMEDRHEEDRLIAKNQLEEFVYSLKEELQGILLEFTIDEERAKFYDMADDIMNWLYEKNGDMEQKQTFIQRLEDLKESVKYIYQRKSNIENRNLIFIKLCSYMKIVEQALTENYVQQQRLLTDEEIDILQREYTRVHNWKDQLGELSSFTCPVSAEEIYQMYDDLTKTLQPILNKKKLTE